MSKAPETRMTLIVGCAPHSPERRVRLEEWWHVYNKVVRDYVKCFFFNGSRQDIDDLTQEFYATALMGDWLSRWDPKKGKFHIYLSMGIKCFVRDTHRKNTAQKRAPSELDSLEDKEDLLHNPQDNGPLSGQQNIELIWAERVMKVTWASLQEERSVKTRPQFDVLKAFFLKNSDDSLDEVAARLGWTPGTVTKEKSLLGKEFRARLRSVVAEDLGGVGDVEAEVRELAKTLGLRRRSWNSPAKSALDL